MDEVVVVLETRMLHPTDFPVSDAKRIASNSGGTLEPIFRSQLPDIPLLPTAVGDDEALRYASTLVPEGAGESVADELRSLPGVEAAYSRHAPELPLAPFDNRDRTYAALADRGAPGLLPPDASFPDFRPGQDYLEASPSGVGVAAAWGRPGGRGNGVTVIDIEGGWCLSHLDLQPNSGLLGGTALPGDEWRDHGTAVLGVVRGTDGPNGVTGIAPECRIAVVSHGGIGASRAIDVATSFLAAGDIMILEMHDAGPRFNFVRRDDQIGYIAMEWWPDIFIAIRRAVAKGIVVVEAGGNGAEDLDTALYSLPHHSFPRTWKNPFGPDHDSGAIVVGAGAPPGGAFGPDRSRLEFSNFGSRVDCQGWGRSVVTTGYGELFGRPVENERFTATFSGTSSASPIVAGAIACLVGAARQAGVQLDSFRIRQLLRDGGAPQQAGPAAPLTQRIGRRPDLAIMLRDAGL